MDSGESAIKGEQSIVDLLRQDYEQRREVEDVVISIPGWERTGLAIKYEMPKSAKELGRIAQKVMRETKDNYERGLLTAIDTIIALSVGLYVLPAGEEDHLPLVLNPGEDAIDFSDKERLMAAFNWQADEIPTARSVVRKLFSNEIQLTLHAEKLDRWMRDTSRGVDEDYWAEGEG